MNLNELGDEFMASFLALGWASRLRRAVRTDTLRRSRAPKMAFFLLLAFLISAVVAQVQAEATGSPPSPPCGRWTDTDFLLATVADFSSGLTGRNFLAVLGATPQAPPATVTYPAQILHLMRDRDPNCCTVVPRQMDDPIFALIEKILSPEERTVEISLAKKDSKKYFWSFDAFYDFDRCGMILHRILAFQQQPQK